MAVEIIIASLFFVICIMLALLLFKKKPGDVSGELMAKDVELETMKVELKKQEETFEQLRLAAQQSALNEKELLTSRFESEIENMRNNHRREIDTLKETYERDLDTLKENRTNDINLLKENHKAELEQVNETYRNQIESLKESHRTAIEEIQQHNKEINSRVEQQYKDAMEALRKQFDETSGKMSEQLRTTTEEMLKQRQEEFSLSSGEKIGRILEPLASSIKEMKETVDKNSNIHTELGGKLDHGLSNLLSHTVAAQASADKLADALRGNSRVQGEWGETILNSLLESQGLKEGVHFETQVMMKDASGNIVKDSNGNAKKPDVILHLDHNRDVVIDSKVSLKSYMDYLEAETEEKRNAALNSHIASIQNHVEELVRKDYSSSIKLPRVSVDYVIMFVPNTSALLLATSTKPDLWRKAMERNVYIADEQTLYAALKIVSLTWKQIVQAQSQQKVFALADEMLSRVRKFMKSYTDIGSSLKSLTDDYNSGMAKLREDGQSIPQTCRKLINLGAKYVPNKKDEKGVDPILLGLEDPEMPEQLP